MASRARSPSQKYTREIMQSHTDVQDEQDKIETLSGPDYTVCGHLTCPVPFVFHNCYPQCLFFLQINAYLFLKWIETWLYGANRRQHKGNNNRGNVAVGLTHHENSQTNPCCLPPSTGLSTYLSSFFRSDLSLARSSHPRTFSYHTPTRRERSVNKSYATVIVTIRHLYSSV